MYNSRSMVKSTRNITRYEPNLYYGLDEGVKPNQALTPYQVWAKIQDNTPLGFHLEIRGTGKKVNNPIYRKDISKNKIITKRR